MCELLVCWADVTSPDFYNNAVLPKKGDVIAIGDDGGVWGVQELSRPDWRIISIPLVDASAMADLTTGEIPSAAVLALSPGVPPRTLQFRGSLFDPSKLGGLTSLLAFLADTTRVTPIFTYLTGILSFRALITQKAPIADPALGQ
jgi:hypothetical protein